MKIYLLFYMCHFDMGLTHCYKTTVFLTFIINGDDGCRLWQPVQTNSQPKSSGFVLGRRPLGAVLHSLNEPGELSQWLCHDDSTVNIVLDIIIISIIIIITRQS